MQYAYDAIEVHTVEGSFFIASCSTKHYTRISCEALLPDRSGPIDYDNDVPVAVRPDVDRAKSLLQTPTYPRALTHTPWERSTLRLASLNTCNDCSGQAE
jgi:hypothetical protein